MKQTNKNLLIIINNGVAIVFRILRYLTIDFLLIIFIAFWRLCIWQLNAEQIRYVIRAMCKSHLTEQTEKIKLKTKWWKILNRRWKWTKIKRMIQELSNGVGGRKRLENTICFFLVIFLVFFFIFFLFSFSFETNVHFCDARQFSEKPKIKTEEKWKRMKSKSNARVVFVVVHQRIQHATVYFFRIYFLFGYLLGRFRVKIEIRFDFFSFYFEKSNSTKQFAHKNVNWKSFFLISSCFFFSFWKIDKSSSHFL